MALTTSGDVEELEVPEDVEESEVPEDVESLQDSTGFAALEALAELAELEALEVLESLEVPQALTLSCMLLARSTASFALGQELSSQEPLQLQSLQLMLLPARLVFTML